MKLCAAENCNIEIQEHRKYCSASCRTRTTNKLFKDYQVSGQTLSIKSRQNYKNRQCIQCHTPISFEQKRNKFCSHSCSATYTNPKNKGIKHKFSDEGKAANRRAIEKRLDG